MSTSIGRQEQHTANAVSQASRQTQDLLGIGGAASDLDESQLEPPRAPRLTDHSHHPTSWNLNPIANGQTHGMSSNQAERQLAVQTYDNFGQHLTGQGIALNHAVRAWEAQSVPDGPLRLIPVLSSPTDIGHQVWDGNGHELHSDTGATRGGTSGPNRE
ncbi:hypothetical protein GGR54DRAFT_500241 [Hypoxylon sp. NC1633]|nr:hypothetical protein GGR54DRAFT_500241 [Hypoxylon sp. NC1633]